MVRTAAAGRSGTGEVRAGDGCLSAESSWSGAYCERGDALSRGRPSRHRELVAFRLRCLYMALRSLPGNGPATSFGGCEDAYVE